ncbi:MAG: lipid-A-disaccharide synthase, partial [Bryobacterales bacterium]|nr:lipid-A-disaccharide synthase [Bryobacterales bacterium]
HMENFREIANEVRACGAYVEIAAPGQLAGALDELLTNRERAMAIGRRALECAQSKRGATERAIDVIRAVSANACPCVRPNLAAVVFLWPVSRIWRWAGQRNRRRQMRGRQRLNVPVISVGNITMGGTGKTPLVLYLAEQMKRAGRSPGILTRGYGRHSLDKNLVLEPGARVKVAQSGDEPQMFLRAGVAPVGIGTNRLETGRLLQERFGADVMILDDGFQHVRLERQVDIVLIDALAPFGDCEVFPLGRLREPLAGLGRADVIVITRSECARGTYGLEQNLRQYNAHAPIFHARSVIEYWVNAASGSHAAAGELPFSRVGAFCGLGNPESFRCTLESLGIHPVDFVVFGDHHAYYPREMRRLSHQFQAAKVEAAVTTEKDAINLCEGCVELMAPIRVYWLKIRTEIDREAEFLQFIDRRLGVAPQLSTAPRSEPPAVGQL